MPKCEGEHPCQRCPFLKNTSGWLLLNILNSSEVRESYPSICDGAVGNPNLRALKKT